mmetsp:Transcript_30067/g.64942  ORF Transcript_30067/g.64942 Transcript_30067/m.64942 type:complete len:364 (+) Transcript_30067:182-1273(+)
MCHNSFTVKNTFIAVYESEEAEVEATWSSNSRKRATTADVATLAYDTLHLEEGGEEVTEEEESQSQSQGEDDASSSDSRPWSTICPEVMDALEQGTLTASEVLDEVRGCVTALALDPAGAALLQSLLDRVSEDEARQLAEDFRGSVVEAVQRQGSAQVLVKLVSLLPSRDIAFIGQELRGQGMMSFLACTLGGAELLASLFQRHWLLQEDVRDLSQELLYRGDLDVAGLCCHKHAYLVVLPLVSMGCEEYQELIVRALLTNVQRYSRHRFASQILAHLLTTVSKPRQEAIASSIMSAAGAVVALACHGFGCAVVRAMLQVPSAQRRVMQYLQKSRVRISKDKFGAELLRDLGIEIPAATVGGA